MEDQEIVIINGRKAILGPEIPLDPLNPDHYDKNKYVIKNGDVATHTKMVMEHLKNESVELQLAGFFHDVGKYDTWALKENGRIGAHGHDKVGAEITERILQRLKFSNEQIIHIVSLVSDHMKAHKVDEMKKSTLRRLIAQPHFDDLVKLLEADCAGSNGDLSEVTRLIQKRDEMQEDLKNYRQLPPPLVSGKDLIELGMKPGPQFKLILDACMDKQLEGTILTKEEGINFVIESKLFAM
jgi:poly(A) polymerase